MSKVVWYYFGIQEPDGCNGMSGWIQDFFRGWGGGNVSSEKFGGLADFCKLYRYVVSELFVLYFLVYFSFFFSFILFFFLIYFCFFFKIENRNKNRRGVHFQMASSVYAQAKCNGLMDLITSFNTLHNPNQGWTIWNIGWLGGKIMIY